MAHIINSFYIPTEQLEQQNVQIDVFWNTQITDQWICKSCYCGNDPSRIELNQTKIGLTCWAAGTAAGAAGAVGEA